MARWTWRRSRCALPCRRGHWCSWSRTSGTRWRLHESTGRAMSVLLHILDTHFGTEKPKVVAALLALARERRPDLLVLSGDITQRAQPAEFEAGRAFCQQLGIARMLALPGNHDLPLLDLFDRMVRP